MKLKIDKFPEYLINFTTVDFDKYFLNKNTILDIGCGEGEFIVDLASLFPKRQFIGVEIKYGRIIKCLKKAHTNKLHNVKFALCDATLFTTKVLKSNSINKVFINNPDPWPKEKHQKNRLVNLELLTGIYQKLKRKGSLIVKTDSNEYFREIKRTILKTNLSPDKSIDLLDSSIPLTKFQKFYKKYDKKIYSIKVLKK